MCQDSGTKQKVFETVLSPPLKTILNNCPLAGVLGKTSLPSPRHPSRSFGFNASRGVSTSLIIGTSTLIPSSSQYLFLTHGKQVLYTKTITEFKDSPPAIPSYSASEVIVTEEKSLTHALKQGKASPWQKEYISPNSFLISSNSSRGISEFHKNSHSTSLSDSEEGNTLRLLILKKDSK